MSMETALRESAVAERHARDLVECARPIGAADRILALGCGTGAVARILRERLGGAASIVGVDDWRQGNAVALPFADGSFDLLLLQEMLPLLPDRMARLREVRRVLSPGGRVLASTCQPRIEEPFDGAALGQALTGAGFTDVHVETNVATAIAPRKEQHIQIRVETHGGNHDVRDR
jgi:ubiquinone/menaquinone biosynthesis C-methylase UbiE